MAHFFQPEFFSRASQFGCYLVVQHDAVDTNCHFQLIRVVKIKKNVAVDKKSSFMFCTHFRASRFQNFLGQHVLSPP